jgi:hypothetical protein
MGVKLGLSPRSDEVTGEWRKLHNEELHILYSSQNFIRQIKSRRMRWAAHVARMGKRREVYKVLVGKPVGKRPLGRPRRRWEDGIGMDLREIGWGGVYRVDELAQVASSCEYCDERSGSGATELVSYILHRVLLCFILRLAMFKQAVKLCGGGLYVKLFFRSI